EAHRATEAAAEGSARAQAVAQLLEQAEQRWRRLDEQLARLLAEREGLAAQEVDRAALDAAAAEQGGAGQAVVAARSALDDVEQARARTTGSLAGAREALTGAESVRAKLAAEAQALAQVLAVKDAERWPPMVDALSVPEG